MPPKLATVLPSQWRDGPSPYTTDSLIAMTHFEAAAQSRRPNAHRSFLLSLGALVLAGFSGCSSDVLPGPEGEPNTTGLMPPGSQTNGTVRFVVEDNNGGQKAALKLKSVLWGRLVDIEDVNGALQNRDYVVGEDILTSTDYQIRTNPVTDRTTVRILYTAGTALYDAVFRSLDQNLILVSDKSLDQSVETPPYPVIPRNAAMVLVFDDLIDAGSINGQNIRVYTGYPPLTPFEARVIPDYGHGDTRNGRFYTTRVIVDSTISEAEAAGDLSGVLTINALGYPASVETTQPNLSIRIPSEVDQNLLQFGRLLNLAGKPISTSTSGSTAQPIGGLSSSASSDVVRAMRSGGATAVTQDINNGYLSDPFPPSILGAQPATLSGVLPTSTAGIYTANIAFATPACASELRVGDVIEQSSVFAEVVCQPGSVCSNGVATSLPVSGTVSGVYLRVVEPVSGFVTNGQAKISVRYSPQIHIGRQACFVRFSSIGSLPSTSVGTDTSVTIAFSEPMDPTSLSAFDTFTLMGPFSGGATQQQEPPANGGAPTSFPRPDQLVVGRVQSSGDLREFTFIPSKNLRHLASTTERYYIRVGEDTNGTPDGTDDALPTDLSGNRISNDLPPVQFLINSAQAQVLSKGFVLRFESLDEVQTDKFQVGATQPYLGATDFQEWRGQYLIDPDRGVFKPRPIQHFPVIQDRIWPVTSLHQPFAGGVQTPLSRLGSHLQTIWRYCDVGFSLLDESTMNLDIEGMAWAPAGGAVQPDNFARFRILLSHSNRLPDESLDPGSLLPLFPNSGLTATYAQNVLDPLLDAPREVHPSTNGIAGYNIAPIKVFQTSYGRFMMPWPLNQDIPVARYSYYTWRDTAIQGRGALPDSPGAELNIVNTVNAPAPAAPRTDPTNNARSIALPIMMEFRCYPDDEATGVNAFDISLATASSARPNWRAFSTGGYNTSNQPVARDPDNDPVALGGFNPNSTPTPGAPTLNSDNSLYIGQLDVVTRISRMYSHWFDTTITSTVVRFDEPILEPAANLQPTGTSVALAFRGATQVQTAAHRTNAEDLDQYGDRRPDATTNPGTPPVFLNNDRTWKSTLASLSNNPTTGAPGARYFQVRVTYTSNNETSLSPEISSLGFAWQE